MAAGDLPAAQSILDQDVPYLPLYRISYFAAIDARFCGGRPQSSASWRWLADVHLCAARRGAVRARTFGLLLLALVGIVPLAVFGRLAVDRSEQTAVAEVRGGNLRLATSIAHRIAAFDEDQRELIASIGAATLAPGVADGQAVLESYAIRFRHMHDLAVRTTTGRRIAVEPFEGDPAPHEPALAAGLSGRPYRSGVLAADQGGRGLFAHTTIVGEPIVIGGKLEGAITARVDLSISGHRSTRSASATAGSSAS